VQEQDSETGAITVTWETIAQVYAEYVAQSAREFFAAHAQQAEQGGRFTIRARTDVDATMRIIHRSKAYQILGVLEDPVSGKEYQTLPVSQGVRV
jgi:SPP1 family predicted phage head-tail adaptor